MKRIINNLFSRAGYSINKIRTLPVQYKFGYDFFKDLKIFIGDDPVDTLLDIGANIGDFSLRIAKIFPSAKILAFEPIDSTYLILKERVAGSSNINIYNFALGSKQGLFSVFLQPNSQLNSLVECINKPSNKEAKSQLVKVKRLDDFITCPITLLKIDTEGFDLEVLKGAKKLLEQDKIKFILCETGFIESDERHCYLMEVKEFLRRFNFILFGIYDICHSRKKPYSVIYANTLFGPK